MGFLAGMRRGHLVRTSFGLSALRRLATSRIVRVTRPIALGQGKGWDQEGLRPKNPEILNGSSSTACGEDLYLRLHFDANQDDVSDCVEWEVRGTCKACS